MSTIRVQTTQNVTIEYEVASVGERIVAAIIDWLILIGWVMACSLLLSAFSSSDGAMVIIGAALIGIPLIFYHLASEVLLNGQSLGKKARNIKVIRLDGTPPQLGDYLLRWVLRIVDMGFFGGLIAVVVILSNGRGQRLGDLAAGTAVVSTRPRQAAGPLAPALTDASYVVVFPQAALLADNDVALIRQLLAKSLERENYVVINEIANKVKAITSIQTDLADEAFLRTILRDHAHLAAMGS